MKLRTLATGLTLALASLAWAAQAGATNPHGTPPGQDTGASAEAKASVAAKGKASAKAHVAVKQHSHAKASVKHHSHAAVKTHVRAGGKAKVAVRGNARGHAAAKTTGHMRVHTKVKSHTAAHGRVHVTAGVGVGASSSNRHGSKKHTAAALATSNATKLYGNGKTAGQIAIQAGFGAALLFGPGNSQPHKILCGRHMVDVHALKAHAGNCQALVVTPELAAALGLSPAASIKSSVAALVAAGLPVTAMPATVTQQAAVKGAAHGAPAKPSATGAGVLGVGQTLAGAAAAPAPVHAQNRSGTLPFTGLGLWLPVALGIVLIAGGLGLRRKANALA